MQSYNEILDAMKETYQERSGSSVADDSDLGIRMQVLASQLQSVYSNIDWLTRQMFVQTANGEYLDMHALEYGMTRKAAVPSSGIMEFYMDEAVWYEVNIPSGTICATAGASPVRFVTSEDVSIPAGAISVTVAAVSEDGGINGNVAAGTIVSVVNPSQGFLKVRNRTAFTGGSDQESDELLRQRIIDTCSAVSNGTNSAFYEKEALKYEGVVSASAIPRARGRGTVDLYLASGGGPSSNAVVTAVRENLQKKKEINVDVEVNPALMQNLTAKVKIEPADGYTLEDLTPVVKETVMNYFIDLKIGQNILIADLGNRLYNIDGVANYSIVNPNSDRTIPPKYVIICEDVEVEPF